MNNYRINLGYIFNLFLWYITTLHSHHDFSKLFHELKKKIENWPHLLKIVDNFTSKEK